MGRASQAERAGVGSKDGFSKVFRAGTLRRQIMTTITTAIITSAVH